MTDPSIVPSCPGCGGALSGDGMCPRCLMAAAAQPTEPGSLHRVDVTLEDVAEAFPQFDVIEFIGQGGMGSVFKVRQPKLERFAAIKLLPESLATDPAFAGRFEREARMLAKLSHPNIVSVYDYGSAGKFFYLLMEFIDGVNLRQAMQAGRFEPIQALGIVPKICDALQYAHDEGVLHRDIKPENILLDSKGRVKLVDFGIAKLAAESESIDAAAVIDPLFTQAGITLGTPSYMAPEQRLDPSQVDQRADIYSLGVVFYELLTGELPTAGLARPSQKSGSDPRLDSIVQQALETERRRRQNSAAELRTQIETSGVLPGDDEKISVNPVFSRLAKLATLWLAVPLVYLVLFFSSGSGPATVPRFMNERPWWEHVWKAALTIGAFAAPIGTTALGWIAVWQIRHSKGTLLGLKLAVFDGLLFPLLALDAAMATSIQLGMSFAFARTHDRERSVVFDVTDTLAEIFLPLLIDGWIIFIVWRAVNHPLNKSPFVGSLKQEKQNSRSWLESAAFLLWGVSGVASLLAWPQMPSPPQLIVWTILVAAIVALVLAIPARASRRGKFILLGSGISIAIWLLVAAAMPSIAVTTPQVTTDLRCVVFEVDAALVDRLIPVSQRRNGIDPHFHSVFENSRETSREQTGSFLVQKSESLTDSQLAKIDVVTLDLLLRGRDPVTDLLLDRTRSLSNEWWHPGVSESWCYSKAFPNELADGNANAFLGFRRIAGVNQLFIDARVTHDITATGDPHAAHTQVASTLFYEGEVQRNHYLAFLVPFFREDDHSAHYLIILYGVESRMEIPPAARERSIGKNGKATLLDKEVQRLKQKLVESQRVYGDNHPVVIRERQTLASMELAARATSQP